jgi:hypothetical protein
MVYPSLEAARTASVTSLAKRNLNLLLAALPGIQLSVGERATLVHLAAGQDAESIRRLTAIMARARSARPLGFAEPSAAEMRPLGIGYPG